MKHNPDLDIKILSYLEEAPANYNGQIEIEGFSEEETSYHIKHLVKRGLVEGLNASALGIQKWLATDLTPQGHIYLKEIQNEKRSKVEIIENMQTQIDSRKVFVVHGRNLRIRDEVVRFLRSINLDPMEWSEARKLTGKTNPYVGEILDAGFSNAQAVLVLFTPDDEAKLLEPFIKDEDEKHERELTPQPRQNVLFEAGMAMAKFPHRTVLVQVGKIRPMSDISGLHIIRLNDSTETRQELAERLRDAGCDVRTEGRMTWHKEGNFRLSDASQERAAAKQDVALGAIEIEILRLIADNNECVEINTFIKHFSKQHPTRVKHHLNILSESEFVYTIPIIMAGQELTYCLTAKAEKYLVDKGLV